MKHTVGVGEMKISDAADDVIVAHSLGSCIGISIYDPVAQVGGLLHFQLPESDDSGQMVAANPFKYADTGIPIFFRAAYAKGASKNRLVVKVAGGARVTSQDGFFEIGAKNCEVMRKVFRKNGVLIDGEDVGGSYWRTMSIDIAHGTVLVKTPRGEYEL